MPNSSLPTAHQRFKKRVTSTRTRHKAQTVGTRELAVGLELSLKVVVLFLFFESFGSLNVAMRLYMEK